MMMMMMMIIIIIIIIMMIMINKNKETEGRLKFGHLTLKRESLSGMCRTCCQDEKFIFGQRLFVCHSFV